MNRMDLPIICIYKLIIMDYSWYINHTICMCGREDSYLCRYGMRRIENRIGSENFLTVGQQSARVFIKVDIDYGRIYGIPSKIVDDVLYRFRGRHEKSSPPLHLRLAHMGKHLIEPLGSASW